MIMVQNDPSYSMMTKLIKLVTGCETFSLLSRLRSTERHCSLDVEAMMGDPMNKETDQELILILNQYGLNDFRGPSLALFEKLKSGSMKMTCQLVRNEDYTATVPQLTYDPRGFQTEKAEGSAPGPEAKSQREYGAAEGPHGRSHQKIMNLQVPRMRILVPQKPRNKRRQAVTLAQVPKHALPKPDQRLPLPRAPLKLLARANSLLNHLQFPGNQVVRGSIRPIMMTKIHGMIITSHIRRPSILTRAEKEKGKGNPTKDMTKVIKIHTKARGGVKGTKEDGSITAIGLELYYFPVENM